MVIEIIYLVLQFAAVELGREAGREARRDVEAAEWEARRAVVAADAEEKRREKKKRRQEAEIQLRTQVPEFD